ncbi:hypothetical protein LOK46_32300 (plasmid) [Methylobacterium sp. NMS14P]|uniref:DUF6894 family protein n=1 Tax=unclassified Methylobacterium TaxID=2615210 RepID=UPI00235902B7|nr:hypothetical protein [Methylobacterium sp. NMS14P]WCS28588.1 hypothetical protein LOK46_32300 [Methylobacterium sp. NMS14P]
MSRFFFNVYDGVSAPDDTGTELANWQDARVAAINLAGSILRDEAHRIALSDEWHIEVTDERGLTLFRFDLFSTLSPVLTGGHGRSLDPFRR